MSKWYAVLAALAVLLVGVGETEATVITIGLGDFGVPVVLDFEGPSVGAISGTDPYFTDAGISSVSVTGGVAQGGALTTNVDGNALASVGGALSIVAPNGALDSGQADSFPVFAFDLAWPHTKFGVSIVDQIGNFQLTFMSAGGTVGTYTHDTLTSPTVYLQSSHAFDRVEISHPDFTHAYGVDNVTLDAIPEPTTLALLSLGVVGQMARARRKRRRH